MGGPATGGSPGVGFYGLLDFTGVPTGVTLSSPAGGIPVGFYGLLDFTGVPTGVQLTPTPVSGVTGGFYGLLDFTGVPTGVGPVVVPPIPGVASLVGGAKPASRVAWASHLQYQSALDDLARVRSQEVILKLTARIIRQHLEYERALFEHRRNAVTAVLLSEL